MKLGDSNAAVVEHCRRVETEMRKKTGYEGTSHTVAVLVYADGRLQFCGADASQMPVELSRENIKEQAFMILNRMGVEGGLS